MSNTRTPMPILTAMHPGNPHGLRFIEGEGGEKGGSTGGSQGDTGEANKGKEEAKTFTQDDMDDLAKKVRAEERRKASERFADYDDLKAKAGESATAEERIANLEKQLEQSNREALRRRVQAAHGISDEDADLFLTGGDEDALTAQAKRLAARESERKSNGNHVPNEGNNPNGNDASDMREFTRNLFARAKAE